MPTLYNPATEKSRFFLPGEVEAARKKGWVVPDETVSIVTPTDEIISIPTDKLDQYLGGGAKIETAHSREARAHETRLKRKYGTGLGTAIRAYLEAGLRGVSVGTSDMIMRILGADAEGLRERQGRHTGTMVAEIGGAILPLFASGGTSLLARTPAGMVMRAGAGAGARTSRALGGLSAGGRVSRTLHTATPLAVGAGVEGALFGAGHGLSKTMLSEDPFSAEALIANMGSGALYGAGAGAAIGGAFGILAHGHGALKAFRQRRDLARAEARIASGGTKGAGKTDDLIGEFNDGIGAMTTSGRQLEGFARKTRNAGMGTPELSAAADDLAKARDRFERLGFTDDAGKVVPVTRGNLERMASKDPAKYDDVVEAVEQYHAAQLRVHDELIASGASAPKTGGPGEMLNPAAYMRLVRETDSVAGELSTLDKLAGANEISDGLTGVGVDDVPGVGKLADLYLKAHILNRMTGGKGLPGGKAVSIGVTANRIARALGHRGGGVRDAASSAYSRIAEGIVKGTGAFVRAGVRAGPVSAATILARARFSDSETSPGRPRKAHEGLSKTQRAFLDRRTEIQNAVSDPEGTVKRVLHNLRNFYAIDQALGNQLLAVSMRKISYLNAKMPKGPQHGALGKGVEYVPSDMEIAKFARIVAAVERPMDVLKNMASMRLTPDEAQAVKTVYPEIYRKIQMTILETLARIDRPLNFEKLIQLSILWDLPAHSAMRPDFASRLRYTFTSEDKPQSNTRLQPKRLPETQETAINRMAQGGQRL